MARRGRPGLPGGGVDVGHPGRRGGLRPRGRGHRLRRRWTPSSTRTARASCATSTPRRCRTGDAAAARRLQAGHAADRHGLGDVQHRVLLRPADRARSACWRSTPGTPSHTPSCSQYVDGVPNHHCMVSLALGDGPEPAAPARARTRWPRSGTYRWFTDGVVRRVPGAGGDRAASSGRSPGCASRWCPRRAAALGAARAGQLQLRVGPHLHRRGRRGRAAGEVRPLRRAPAFEDTQPGGREDEPRARECRTPVEARIRCVTVSSRCREQPLYEGRRARHDPDVRRHPAVRAHLAPHVLGRASRCPRCWSTSRTASAT